MNVVFRKRFLKELSKIPKGERSKIEFFIFEQLPEAKSLSELGNVEHMKGYRAKAGSFTDRKAKS